MNNDELNREQVSLAAKVGKLTYEEIKKALDKLLKFLKDNKQKSSVVKHGKQSLKELNAQNSGLSSMELKDPNLRQLNPCKLLWRTFLYARKAAFDFGPTWPEVAQQTLYSSGFAASTTLFALPRNGII